MKKAICLFIFLMFLSLQLYAVFEEIDPSPQATAIGGAKGLIKKDPFSIFYNPASLIDITTVKIAFTYKQIYNVEGLSFIGFGAGINPSESFQHIPHLGVLGIGYVTLGDSSVESEKVFGLAHAFSLNPDITFGYAINYYSASMNPTDGESSSYSTLGINVGAIATIYEKFKLAFYYKNINSPSIGEKGDLKEEIPQEINISFAYMPYPFATTYLEMSKNMNEERVLISIKGGQEFYVIDNLALRFGVNSNPAIYSAGLRFQYNIGIFTYTIYYHSDLNATHHFAISVDLDKYLKRKVSYVRVEKKAELKPSRKVEKKKVSKSETFELKLYIADSKTGKPLSGVLEVYPAGKEVLLLKKEIKENGYISVKLLGGYSYDVKVTSSGYTAEKFTISKDEITPVIEKKVNLSKAGEEVEIEESKPYTVIIYVKDKVSGKPLEGTIEIYAAGTTEKLIEEKTDLNGKAEFPLLRDVDYELVIKSSGYKPVKQKLVSSEIKEKITLQIELEKE